MHSERCACLLGSGGGGSAHGSSNLQPQGKHTVTAGGLATHLAGCRAVRPHVLSAPAVGLQCVLAAGKQMQHLRLLSLSSGRAHGGSPSGEAAALLDSQHWCLDSKDINSITNSCPALQSLCLCHVVRPTADLRSLSWLGTTLETLAVAGAAFKLGAARAVAQVTNLQTLTWCDSPLADAGLRQFTALTALTKLELHNCKLSQKLVNVPSGFGRVRSMAGIGKTTEFMLHKFAVSVTWARWGHSFASLELRPCCLTWEGLRAQLLQRVCLSVSAFRIRLLSYMQAQQDTRGKLIHGRAQAKRCFPAVPSVCSSVAAAFCAAYLAAPAGHICCVGRREQQRCCW